MYITNSGDVISPSDEKHGKLEWVVVVSPVSVNYDRMECCGCGMVFQHGSTFINSQSNAVANRHQ